MGVSSPAPPAAAAGPRLQAALSPDTLMASPLNLKPGDVLLVRHGETEWSENGRHTGRTDIPLTPEGVAAAGRLRPLLTSIPFSLVLCSPLRRARQTCEAAGLSPGAELEPDLMEWDYGAYEGLTTGEIHAERPDWLVFRDGCPAGERPAQVAERADRLITRIRATQGPVALVAHGHFLRVLGARWIEQPPIAGARFLLDTANLSVLSHYRGVPAIGAWNLPHAAVATGP